MKQCSSCGGVYTKDQLEAKDGLRLCGWCADDYERSIKRQKERKLRRKEQ